MITDADAITAALVQAAERPSPQAAAWLSDWVPQRGPADDGVAVVKNLFRILGTPITDTTVDEQLPTMDHYPSLAAIEAFLTAWGFRMVGGRLSCDQLGLVSFPAIGHLAEGQFVLLLGLRDDKVFYLHPGRGWQADTLEAFGGVWDGTVLLALDTPRAGEPDYDRRRTAEVSRRDAEPARGKVTMIEDFLTPRDCAALIGLMQDFQRSEIALECGRPVTCETRTSRSAGLPEDHPLTALICHRAAGLLGLPVSHCERPGCLAYGPGQEFQVHRDAFGKDHPFRTPEEGDRLATVVIYLNSDVIGGETYFPLLDVKVAPRVGRAVHWLNLDDDEEIDWESSHAGLPVYAGTKYAVALHLRTRPQPPWLGPALTTATAFYPDRPTDGRLVQP